MKNRTPEHLWHENVVRAASQRGSTLLPHPHRTPEKAGKAVTTTRLGFLLLLLLLLLQSSEKAGKQGIGSRCGKTFQRSQLLFLLPPVMAKERRSTRAKTGNNSRKSGALFYGQGREFDAQLMLCQRKHQSCVHRNRESEKAIFGNTSR